MLESVSPYALLRASVPKPVASAPTVYDLYSLSQGAPAFSGQSEPIGQHEPVASGGQVPAADPKSPAQNPAPQRSPSFAAAPPARRTHYISDIKSRHSAAVSRTTFTAPKN